MDPVLKANQTVGTFPLVLTPKNPWNNLERQGSPPHNPGKNKLPLDGMYSEADSASLDWPCGQDGRLPKQLLFGELREGVRCAGGQPKRYKDATRLP